MKKILVVDDEPNIGEVLYFFASQMGFSSDVTNCGEDALDMICTNDYWAMMCDFHMPGLNGMEIFDKVRELAPELSRKFVLLTGAVFDDTTEIKIAEQNIKVLTKPFLYSGFQKIFSELEM